MTYNHASCKLTSESEEDWEPCHVQGGVAHCSLQACIISAYLAVAHFASPYAAGDLTYTLGNPLNDLAKLFIDEQLLDRLKTFTKQKPQILSPTFLAEANEARIVNTDWLRFQGADACAWLSSRVSQGSSRG